MGAQLPTMRQLLVRLVVLSQVPALVAIAGLLAFHCVAERQFIVSDMHASVEDLATSTRRRLEDVQRHLEVLAAKAPPPGADLAEFHGQAALVARIARVDTVVLVAPSGTQLVNTRVAFGSALPTRTPDTMLSAFRTGRWLVTDVAPAPLTRQPVIGVSVPVIQHADIVYALNAGLEVRRFADLIRAQKLPAGWSAALVDGAGQIVAEDPPAANRVQPPVLAQLADGMRRAGSGVFEWQRSDGTDMVTTYEAVQHSDWAAVVTVPSAVLYAPAWKAAGEATLAIAVLVALGLAAAFRVAACMTQSMASLTGAARALPEPFPAPAGCAFREAAELHGVLEQSVDSIQSAMQAEKAAQDEVQRVRHDFQRALMKQVDVRQGEIARELHDSVGSTLAGVSLLLGGGAGFVQDPRGQAVLRRAQEQVQTTARHVRQISRGLMPAGSEAGALLPALEQFAADIGEIKGVACTVRARGDFARLPPNVGAQLHRIVQEATANSLRHGHATRIRIALARAGSRCRLTVADNGTGCDFAELPQSHPGLGVQSIHARAAAIDGSAQLRRRTRGGCIVTVAWHWDTA